MKNSFDFRTAFAGAHKVDYGFVGSFSLSSPNDDFLLSAFRSSVVFVGSFKCCPEVAYTLVKPRTSI
nr:MAG TPA: hypothetical protein [Caudoviricetes sp.]